MGRRCNLCEENTRSKDTSGRTTNVKECEPCEDCYNLVKEAADRHRANLKDLDDLLRAIAENPQPVSGDFRYQLNELQLDVTGVLADAKINSVEDGGDTLRYELRCTGMIKCCGGSCRVFFSALDHLLPTSFCLTQGIFCSDSFLPLTQAKNCCNSKFAQNFMIYFIDFTVFSSKMAIVSNKFMAKTFTGLT